MLLACSWASSVSASLVTKFYYGVPINRLLSRLRRLLRVPDECTVILAYG